MKQTAVEWLVEQLRQLAFNPKTHLGMGNIRVTQGLIDELAEQAKQMEREQIIDAIMHSLDEDGHTGDWKIKFANEYYDKMSK